MKHRILALVLSILMAFTLLPLDVLAANVSNGETNLTAVTCFYAQTNQDYPKRQSSAASIFGDTITDDEGKGICMLFVPSSSFNVYDYGVGATLSDSGIRKSSTGKNLWAYCIQHHVSANDGLGYTGQNADVDQFWRNLSISAQNGIQIALICGFPNSNFGYKNCDAYAATQALIWEFQYNNQRTIKYTNGKMDGTSLSGSGYRNVFSHATTSSAYDALLAKVNSYLTGPVLSGTNYNPSNNKVTLKWNSTRNRYEATLTDSKNVISNYKTSGSSGSLNWTISNNTITVYTTDSSISSTQLMSINHKEVNSLTASDQPLLVLNHASQQKAIVGCGTTDPIPLVLNADVERVGSIEIQKTAPDDGQLRMQYKITSDKSFTGSTQSGSSWIKTVWTDASTGKVKVDGFLRGSKVKVEEILSATQSQYYSVSPSSKSVNITIEAGQTKTANFTNNRIKSSFAIYKTDGETVTPVSGAKFEIVYDNNYTICGHNVNKGDTVKSNVMNGLNPSNGIVITDEAGQAVISNLQIYDDSGNPINYRFVEIESPKGYLVSDMATKTSEGNTFTLQNKQGQVLNVTDLDNFENGVEEDRILQKIAVAKKGEMLTASSDEQIVVGKDEEVIEYKAPVYEEKFAEGAIYDIYVLDNVDFCDDLTTPEVEYYKDSDGIIYTAGTVVDTLVTTGEADKAGWATSKDLPIGRYKVVERVAPDGFYNDNTNQQEITLEDNENDNGLIHYVDVDANFVNKRIQLKIELEKLIEENENYPNPDAYKEIAYGVYCEEDIFGYGGVKIFEKGDLVDVITLDKVLRSDEQVIGIMYNGDAQKDGEGNNIYYPDYIYKSIDDSDLPISNYTLKEIRTDKGLWMDARTYKVPFADEITCTAEGIDENGNIADVQRYDESVDTHLIQIFKTDADGNVRIDPATGEPMPLENHVIRGAIDFYKKSLDGDEISGVKFGVWRAGEDADEWIDSKETSGTAPLYTVITGSNGYARIDDIPAGDYILREIQPAKVRLTEMIEVEQFYLNKDAFPFTIEDKDNSDVHTILIDMPEIVNVYKEGYLVPGASDVPMIYLPKDKVKGDYTTSVNTFDANQIFAPMMLTCVSAIAIALIKGKRYKLMKAYFRK